MEKWELFFISYDEPEADLLWESLKSRVPWAQRVHGVKGFDAAYKACAKAAQSERYFTVDGDNELLPAFFELNMDFSSFPEDAVLSWNAKNSINGQCYGNGGIKNWPRTVALGMQTHESTGDNGAAVDFCFRLNYYRMRETLSVARIHGSPYQAFRSGFREGVKMCLERGKRAELHKSENRVDQFYQHVSLDNLNRLKIWCSIGADVENGLWAIWGARVGCEMLCLSEWDHFLIRDYDWFDLFWQEKIKPRVFDGSRWNLQNLENESEALRLKLNEQLGLGLTTMKPEDSLFFKSVYRSPQLPIGPIFSPPTTS